MNEMPALMPENTETPKSLSVAAETRNLYSAERAKDFKEALQAAGVAGVYRSYFTEECDYLYYDSVGYLVDTGEDLEAFWLESDDFGHIKRGALPCALALSDEALEDFMKYHIRENSLHFGYSAFYTPDLVVIASHYDLEPLAVQQIDGKSGNLIVSEMRPNKLPFDITSDPNCIEAVSVWISETLDKNEVNTACQLAERVLLDVCRRHFDKISDEFVVEVQA